MCRDSSRTYPQTYYQIRLMRQTDRQEDKQIDSLKLSEKKEIMCVLKNCIKS